MMLCMNLFKKIIVQATFIGLGFFVNVTFAQKQQKQITLLRARFGILMA